MALLESLFFWISVVIFAGATIFAIFSAVFKRSMGITIAFYLSLGAFLSLTIAILSRYFTVGNLPVAGTYESSLGGVWVIMGIYILGSLRYTSIRTTAIFLLPFCLILLGIGVMSDPVLVPMAVSLKSFWLYVHVVFAWLAFGAFSVCAGIGTLYLLKEKALHKELYSKIPSLERLEELMFKYLVFGFIMDAIMIASGAVWAKNLWGHYWNWDPVETWSLITWLIYGLAIHLRVTMGWRGRRFALILIFALPGMVITYFGIDLLVSSSLHIFKAWQKI